MIGSCRKWTLRWGVTVLALLGQAEGWNACFGQAELVDAATVARYFQAIAQGDANAVTQYLRQGAPIDARNELGLTGLHLAAYQRREGAVQAILAALPRPAATPPADRPLGFDEYLESLSFNRHLEHQKRNEVLDARTPQAMTALHLAIGAIREEEEVYARTSAPTCCGRQKELCIIS